MANVEDRVVSMAFESTKFQSGISQTMSSMDKFNAALKNLGAHSGLDNIEKSASKISLSGPMSALDKLKAKFGRGVPEAQQAFSDVEKASNKVGFLGIGSAIDKLKGKFNFGREANTAFAEVERASGRVSFSGLTQALDGLGGKFSIVSGAAAVAFGNIATRAAMLGGNMAKSLTLDPVSGGLKEYETNLNSIQTILANTQASGAKLKDVKAALNELNTYSDKTIYNFSEMARNIGTFTAAGVDLKTATGSIKGIANLAAVSGSNSQQASTAMYQLSQAISSGRVSLQDWNSVVNAGMGGTVFQRALAQTAQQMGTIKDGALKLKGPMKNVTIGGKSFRESITAKPGEKSWLTSDVLTKTLQQFTGDLSDADLKAQGFNDSQIKAIQSQAKMAQKAATQVKTLSALLDTTKEQVGSGWAKTWEIIFGDFGEAPKLFTGLSNAIGGFVSDSAKSRNNVLKDWKALGGRKDLIDGLKIAFRDLAAVVKPIKEAFRDVFPKQTGKDLAELTHSFREFMAHLRIGPETAENMKRTFRGLFAVLDIGKQIVGGIFTVIKHLLGELSNGSGGVLHFTGNVGDLLVALDEWLKKGNRLHDFFVRLGDLLTTPIRLIGLVKDKLSDLFNLAPDSAGIGNAVGGWESALKPANKAADTAKNAWEGFLHILEKVRDVMSPVVDGIGQAFGGIGDAIADAFTHQNFDTVFKIIQTGLIAGIFLAIKKGIAGGVNIDLGGGLLKSVTGVMNTLTGSLKSMQTDIKAHTLLQIGAAVALLAASAVALSLVKPEKLASSMTAMAVGIGQLVAAMALINKLGLKGVGVAAGLILIATAMDVLTVAIIALSQLSWSELARGLAGVAGGLTVLVAASGPLSKASPRLVIAGVGLTAIGVALNILAVAMKVFATMSWEDLGKGLAGVTAALIGIGLAMNLMPLTLPITAAGLVLVGIGLTAISGAIAILGHMDVKTLAKGIGAISLALVGIGLAMSLMPPTLPLTAAGLILVGVALTAISGAIGLLGNMDWGTLVKGIAGIAASLVVLAGGLTLMVAALPGAAALLVASAALAIFAPVLGILGNMKWSTIGKGLAAMAAGFIVLAAGGALAAGPLVALGIGIGVLGVGVLALGAGVKLLAQGVKILATDGAKGFAVFVAALTGLIIVMPKLVIDFVKGIVEIVAQIAKLAPSIVKSLVVITGTLLTGLIALAPKAATAITALITAMLSVIARNAGPILKAGGDILVKLLKGISGRIGEVTKSVATIVAKFLGALANKVPSIVSAGATILAKFLVGIANSLSKVVVAAATIVAKLVGAIGSGASKLATAGVNLVIKLVSSIGSNANRVVTAGANILTKFLSGIADNIGKVANKGVDIATRLINSLSKATLRLVNEGAKTIIRFLNGIADAIRKYEPQVIRAGANIASAIIDGLVSGLGPGRVIQAAKDLAGHLPKWVKKVLHIKSPSAVFAEIGGYVVEGLAQGLGDSAPRAVNSMITVGQGIIEATKALFGIRSPSTVMQSLGQFVGQGFADGIRGSSEDIDKAFTDLNNKINAQLGSAKDRVAKDRKRLNDLLDAKHKDKEAIADARKAISAENALIHALTSTSTVVNKSLAGKHGELKKLSDDYAEVTKKLEDARSKLEDLKQAKESFASSTIDQFSALPEVVKSVTDAEGTETGLSGADQVSAYTKALGDTVTATQTYADTLDQLRKLGLDDATYRKLLAEGPADQAFASALLAGGQSAVNDLNVLDARLSGIAGALGTKASNDLYNVGIQAQAGLVNGLKAEESKLHKAVEAIATAMIKAIKKKLKIKSPSEEFAEIGTFSAKGVVRGLEGSSKMVSDAAAGVGEDALAAMRNSVAQMSEKLKDEMDTDPTITPILDLTKIKEDAKKMADLTNIAPIAPSTSFGMAAALSGAEKARLEELAAAGAGPPVLKFEQTNNSPKALSEAEIYRQTNNQLSQAKSALGL